MKISKKRRKKEERLSPLILKMYSVENLINPKFADDVRVAKKKQDQKRRLLYCEVKYIWTFTNYHVLKIQIIYIKQNKTLNSGYFMFFNDFIIYNCNISTINYFVTYFSKNHFSYLKEKLYSSVTINQQFGYQNQVHSCN